MRRSRTTPWPPSCTVRGYSTTSESRRLQSLGRVQDRASSLPWRPSVDVQALLTGLPGLSGSLSKAGGPPIPLHRAVRLLRKLEGLEAHFTGLPGFFDPPSEASRSPSPSHRPARLLEAAFGVQGASQYTGLPGRLSNKVLESTATVGLSGELLRQGCQDMKMRSGRSILFLKNKTALAKAHSVPLSAK